MVFLYTTKKKKNRKKRKKKLKTKKWNASLVHANKQA